MNRLKKHELEQRHKSLWELRDSIEEDLKPELLHRRRLAALASTKGEHVSGPPNDYLYSIGQIPTDLAEENGWCANDIKPFIFS